MIELGRLYQEIAELVHMQEPAVEQIDQQAEDVVGNVQQANTQIDSAISSARKARKWKWYALLIISEYPSPVSEVYVNANCLISSDYRYCRGCCRWCDPSKQERQISMISFWSWSCSYSILFSLIQFYIPLYAVYGCYNTCPSFASPCFI